MTALNTPIAFNNSTGGSDSTASGSPSTRLIPSILTLQISSGSNVAYGSASGAVNPGDLVYAPSQTSGRKFNVVASINTSTFPYEYTFDDNWDATDFSATCYSGGKRATLDNADSRLIVTTDNPTSDQWTVVLENTGTDYSITSMLSLRSVTIKGDSESSPTGVTFNQNSPLFNAVVYGSTVRDLHLKCTASSKTSATAFNKGANNAAFEVHNVTFDATDNWNKAFGNTAIAAGGLRVFKCKVNNTITNISDWGNINQFYDCVFSNCTGNGIASRSSNCVVKNCIFNECSGSLIYQVGNPGTLWLIDNNIFNGGSSSVGIAFYTYTWQMAYGGAFGNIFAGMGTAISNNPTDTGFQVSRNAFYNNTTDYSGTHDGNITLQSNPFVDPTASPPDFNLNSNLGGGSVLRSTKFTIGG
jgi:hypothetical protein